MRAPVTPPGGPLQVVYDVRGTLEKNRDTFRDDILNLLRESRSVQLPERGAVKRLTHLFIFVVFSVISHFDLVVQT